MTLDDGEQIAVDLELDEQSLTLRTDGALIGAWPVKYCRVARSGRGAVLLSIDGEKVVFEPDDLPLFATTAAKQFRASSLADRVGVVRDIAVADAPERSRSRSDARGDSDSQDRIAQLRRWSVPIVAAVGLIVLAGLAMRWVDARGPAVTTTTFASTIVTAPPLFDQTVEQFTDEWNLVAATFGVPIQIRDVLVPGQFEARLTPFLTLQGRTDRDGTIGSIILVIDPGETGDEQVALTALGVAITVANPELGRDGRAEVLDGMGLSTQDPAFAGLDGSAEVGQTAYTLRYIDEFGAVLFTINRR